MTILAIASVIAIPLIFAALGATQAAGLALGVILVVVGLGWSAIGSRRAPDEPDDQG
jgi:glycogen synthase